MNELNSKQKTTIKYDNNTQYQYNIFFYTLLSHTIAIWVFKIIRIKQSLNVFISLFITKNSSRDYYEIIMEKQKHFYAKFFFIFNKSFMFKFGKHVECCIDIYSWHCVFNNRLIIDYVNFSFDCSYSEKFWVSSMKPFAKKNLNEWAVLLGIH